jgi:hypothetical protein
VWDYKLLLIIFASTYKMNWDQIISKRTSVKTKDNENFGYVAGQYKDNFLVIEGRVVSHEYMIPKNEVEDYDGRELSLRIRQDQISPDFDL